MNLPFGKIMSAKKAREQQNIGFSISIRVEQLATSQQAKGSGKGWMCKSQPTDDKLSLIGVWSGHVTLYKILGAPIISLERLNLKSSNFVHE